MDQYPLRNRMRNLVMEKSESDFIVSLDVDLIPGPRNFYAQVLSTLRVNNSSLAQTMQREKRVMVIPAFEVMPPPNQTHATRDQLPQSKEDLHHLVSTNKAAPFHLQNFPWGYGPTDYERWFNRNDSAEERDTNTSSLFYPISYSFRFEPYVLAYRPGLPRFWEGFRGFGFNKWTWYEELHRAGYEFGTLFDFYAIHLKHPSLRNSEERDENGLKYEAFQRHLDDKYPPRHRNEERYHSFPYYRSTNRALKKHDAGIGNT